ncbi:hypothetical protein ASPVEDRAFT_36915 [Aspergillus versicolor CBS 583.65]|uniref:Uncharacterized protein n=1 Tax=Aspergillus versicolor CBS 583.65 TaxID=1036611 RepID=A0A1L9P7T0_ASPVE|nr:uncharacterized protein ASPVEDRAFT_36915 [Aspergillus versicolor CBS 583.65]OJI97503.1 hypothetical protein ASPVEDRAFT_36915 [Aspergillus versicolor CBS 583.65]
MFLPQKGRPLASCCENLFPSLQLPSRAFPLTATPRSVSATCHFGLYTVLSLGFDFVATGRTAKMHCCSKITLVALALVSVAK